MAELPEPRQVLLFSGHRVDAPDRAQPRFPPALVPAVERRLAAELEQLGAGASDLALCQAAAGGDLLFLEACQARGVACRVLLPSDESAFIAESILSSSDGQDWLQRWQQVRQRLAEPPRCLGDELGPTPPAVDRYERCNRWLLDSALAFGADRLRFLCLWDGKPGDGPGGVRHMIDAVQALGGTVRRIDMQSP
ncbi:hypothetical protein [Piscinibacter sakaiensis]|uniref:hypothetical protein n=1 Tax=Piscinibacter sakaiensis TaxID=1547922 RepID=UPI003AAC6E19